MTATSVLGAKTEAKEQSFKHFISI